MTDVAKVGGLVPELSEGTVLSRKTGVIDKAYTTVIAENDPIVVSSAGKIERSATAVKILGTFRGCTYKNTEGFTVKSKSWPGSTIAADAEAEYIQNPTGIYTMVANEEASSNDELGADDMFSYCDIVVADGDKVNGSKVMIDQSTKSTSSGQVQILELVKETGNDTHGNGAKYRIKINESVV